MLGVLFFLSMATPKPEPYEPMELPPQEALAGKKVELEDDDRGDVVRVFTSKPDTGVVNVKVITEESVKSVRPAHKPHKLLNRVILVTRRFNLKRTGFRNH